MGAGVCGERAVSLAIVAVLITAVSLPRAFAAGLVGTGTPGSCTEVAFDAALGCGAPRGSPPFSNCAGGVIVTFNCGGAATITVTSTKSVSADTAIDDGSLITISGGNSVGVFSVNTGVNFTVKNLTIANGNNAGYGGSGGGIISSGTLAVTNSTFSSNHAAQTGGTAVDVAVILQAVNNALNGCGSG